MATASMHVQEPPRLAGALRAKQRGAFLDLPHLMAARPQAAAAARARRARSGGDNCFSWAQFAGGNTAKDAAAVAARENHHKLLKLVAEMLGGEASSQELHGAAQLVFDVLSAAGRSPADRRAELVAGIGFIEQEAFKAAVSLVNELQTWRASVSGEPDVQRAAHKDSCAQAPASQAPESQRAAVCEVRRDRAIDWARDLDSLPLYDSDAEEDTDGHDSGAAGASEGHCAGAEGDPVEFLEARLCQHCAALGLPADAVVEDVFRCLSSARGMDEVQSVLCDLVGFEALDLIGDLLQARTSIAVHVSQQRMARLSADASAADLAAPAAIGGFSVTTAANQQLMKQMKKDERRRRKQEADPEEDGWLKLQGFNPAELRAKREAELAAGPQSSSRGPTTFDGSVAGFAGAAKLSLPTGTRRILHDKENYEEILVPPQTKAPVRGHERRIPTNEFSAFCQPAFEGIPELNRVQSIVYPVAYKTGNNMLVCAPTGAGKTECAMMTVLHCLEQHLDRGVLKSDEFKIVYVAPMKALASEVTDKFSKRLGRLGLVVKELTGDMKLSRREITDTHMLVVTPEKWDVMTRKSSDAALTSLVKLLIIDEIHLLNEDRGAVLEAIVARTLRQVERSQSMIRIVGLSATLPTYKDVAVFLRVNVDRDLFYFDNAYRPVPLETAFIGVTGNNQNKQRATMLDVTYKKVLERVRAGHQVMVFVHSRKDTYKTARTLMEMAQQEGTIADLDPSNHPRYGHWEKIVAKSRNKEIRELFAAGLSCHHAGILRSDRNMVEKLFAEGVVKVLLCTATLAWGVNLPAHSVIIKGTQVYDAKKGSFVELGVLDVMQIFGRAGRPQFDSSGEGIIITTHDKLNHYLQLMHNALPIESQFLPALTDHLNAEVVLGTVSNTTEAVAWLTYTYCYVRMLRNPMHYGVPYHELQADPRLHARCRELIEGSVKELAKAKMLRFNFETTNMNTTDTGIVASHFYVKYASLELYNELVHPAMSEADCFEVVAKSSEFENVQARDEENQELVKLLANVCPIKIKCQAIEGEGVVIDQVAKVNILLQAYISKAEVDGFALVADMNHVVQSAGRIFRALFELCVKKGFVTLANKLLTLNKVVTQRLWPHQHALRQFGHLVPADWCFRLEQKNLDVDKLWDMDHKEISGLIRQNNSGLLIQKFVGQFPWLNIQVNVQPITRTILRVTLNIKAQFEWNDRASGSVEPFWVWVEDNENERIYHTEYFLLHKQQMRETHVLAFTVPLFEPLQGQYVVRAISDRWLHAEHAEVINLRDLVLPEKYPPHTTLLKLCPLPKEALQNTQFQSLYKFTHFNAIQTQVFHTLYHTDVNVLLGAPTGSGKTNCCELAMMRLFRTRPKAKFVYVAPMKALVRERMKDWGVRLANVLGKKVVELTGDVSDMGAVDGADVIVTTPEKWDGVSRSWRSRKYVQSVGLVVIDEIHLLGEDRGPVLEVIVSRMRYISAQTASPVRFVGMSTAIANAQDVADWLGAKDGGVFNFHPSVRPVPMQVHIQGYEGQFYCPRMATMNKPTFAAIQDYSKDKPVIVFVSSRRQTRLTALDLIQLGAQSENPRQWVHADDDELGSALAKLKDPNLRHTLSFGIGLHHAGLCEGDRSIVENLFEQCKIQVLVSTSTLAWGVNLPAHLVVIKGTEFYDAPSKRYVDFPITDVLQMMGRAGRPQFDTVGIAVVMVHAPKKAFYKRFLYEPFPVESSLADALHNHLNAEIVSGTIKGKADAVDYLTWTYLFRRLLCNPSYYHLEDTSHEGMSSYLASLVQHTLEDLEDSECIQVTENEIAATTLGRITAYYYLDHTTAHMFASQVEEMVDEKTVLHVLSRATEFAELPVRHNEEHLNSDLAKLVTFGAMGGAMESPHTKTSLLIQAHIGKVPMPIADYNTDLRSVLEQTGRVLQALVDVTADSGYLSAALHAMRLSQAMTQCLFAHQSSLLTLPHANPRVVQQLQQSGVAGLAQLVAMPQSEVVRLLRRCGLADANIKTATSILAQLPSVRLAASLVGVEGGKTPFALGSKAGLYEMEAGSEGEVCLRIEQINASKRGCRAYVPRSPNLPSKARDEGWWAVVGCKETDELLALKRLTIRRNSTSTVLSFLAPEDPGHACLTAYLVSDCYLGLDVESDLPLLLHPASS